MVSVLNWDYATKIGIQEEGLIPEFKVYEHAIAVSDVSIGWIYSLAGIGLILDTEWGNKLALISGAILVYHSIGFWSWNVNQRKLGHQLNSLSLRIGWSVANMISGLLAIFVAWTST